MTKRNP